MGENIEIIKEQNRHEEETQKNTMKAVALGATTAIAAYGTKKLAEKYLGVDEGDALVSVAIELLNAW